MSEQQLNLFGEEVIETAVKRIGRNERFEDYDAFIDKHEIKKTTDDCYTPPEVYKVIRDYVGELTDLSDRAVVRPFFPGGDYQRFGYPEDCIVIDNPPFSIITKIVRWYDQAGIDYFLFAPHITIFDCQAPCSVLTDANIKYANGAVVKTSFVTNIIRDTRVWLNADLRKRINDCCDIKEHQNEKKSYPSNVINAASCGKLLSRGFDLKIPNDESQYVRNIDELQNEGMRIFGGGMLLSDRIAEIFDKEKSKKYERIVNLSERERRIIKQLNHIKEL